MLSVRGLNVYYGYIQIAKDISIEVRKGTLTALIGPNGSGKTSILRAIIGLIPIRQGRVILNEIDITNRPTEEIITMGMSMVPERREIFTNLSVLDNLWMGAYQRSKRVSKRIIQEDIDLVCNIFPILKKRAHQVGKTLSGGEQQMLAIGRALMSKPKILLLDEPSLGLAPLIVQEIFEILKELQKAGTTILLIEQGYKEMLSIIERCYVLQTGRVVWEGVMESIDEETLKTVYLGNGRKNVMNPRIPSGKQKEAKP